MCVTEPLRSEHAELRPHLDQLDSLAASLTRVDDPAARLAEVVEFLQHHLAPHAQAEEAALYPEVERALGAPGATATLGGAPPGGYEVPVSEAGPEVGSGGRPDGRHP